jgi:hypothetical protein
MRRLVALGALLAGAVAGLAFFRRRGTARGERVDLFYEDGSVTTLADDDAQPLLEIARSALAATKA